MAADGSTSSDENSGNKAKKRSGTTPQLQPLVTSLGETSPPFGEVSTLPTPRLPSAENGIFESFSGSVRSPSGPVIRSATTRLHPLVFKSPNEEDEDRDDSTPPPRVIKPKTIQVPVNTNIQLPKRGQFKDIPHLDLNRQSSTRLHRELLPPTSNPVVLAGHRRDDEVYLAFDREMHLSTWERVHFLGKGSFSEVVLAKPVISHVKPVHLKKAANLLVAVKITRLNGEPKSPQRMQLEEALRRDIELLVDLPPHPCLMRLLAFNLDKERALSVLPFCSGGDLFDLIAKYRSKLGCGLVRRIFADIVGAVAYLHSNLIVHRDIKLENVLLDLKVEQLLVLDDPIQTPHALAVLTDLGLARRIDPVNPLLSTRCGSEDYVPPELIMGRPYDGRETDCWALGVLLYAMLEGRLPFDPPPLSPSASGPISRSRPAHRIARVSWAWYKRTVVDEEWQGGKTVVERCLQRREQRISIGDLLQLDWVADAKGPEISLMHDPDIEDLFEY